MVNYKYLVMVGASFLLCLARARHTGSQIINIFCHHNIEAVRSVILILIKSLVIVPEFATGKCEDLIWVFVFYVCEYQDVDHLGGFILRGEKVARDN